MGLDLDAGHDGLDVAAGVEQRRQAGPALLAHAVAFVEDHHAAADHGRHQRRGHVAQLARAFDDRRDQQVLGARVHGGLHDVDLAAEALGGGVGQGGLPDARLAHQARVHRQIPRIDHQPGRQQLPQRFFLPDPAHGQLIRVRQVQRDAFDLHGHSYYCPKDAERPERK